MRASSQLSKCAFKQHTTMKKLDTNRIVLNREVLEACRAVQKCFSWFVLLLLSNIYSHGNKKELRYLKNQSGLLSTTICKRILQTHNSSEQIRCMRLGAFDTLSFRYFPKKFSTLYGYQETVQLCLSVMALLCKSQLFFRLSSALLKPEASKHIYQKIAPELTFLALVIARITKCINWNGACKDSPFSSKEQDLEPTARTPMEVYCMSWCWCSFASMHGSNLPFNVNCKVIRISMGAYSESVLGISLQSLSLKSVQARYKIPSF